MRALFPLMLLLAVLPSFAQQSAHCADLRSKVDQAQKRMNDWAELGRYREANAKVIAPKPGERPVVFIGDSITDLWDDEGFGGFFPGKHYINRGISGQTTPQMLVRFRADVISHKPKVVVILAGTNDIAGNTGPMSLEETTDNIASMAELAEMNGIKVILASVLPVSDTVKKKDGGFYIQTGRRHPAKIVALNVLLKHFAAERGHTYLDYYSAMVDKNGFVKDEITYDGLHPNAKGYAIMAPLAEQAIEKALKSKR